MRCWIIRITRRAMKQIRALPSPVGELSGYYSLHTYDLVTGETADLKIVGIFAAAAGNTVLSYNYGRYRVYLLP